MEEACVSCGKAILNDSGATRFKCPECDNIIIRCSGCRKAGIKYTCSKCGFEGPN